MSPKKIIPCILLFLACLLPLQAGAQVPPAPEAETAEDPAAPELPPDPLNRRTPQGFVFGLIEALAAEDHARAARYLDLGGLPKSRRAAQGTVLAEQLQTLLDVSGWVRTPRQLSGDPVGALDDELAPELGRFATVRTPDGPVDLFLERTEHPELGPIWLVSAETVAEIPELAAQVSTSLLDRWLPEAVADGPRLLGAPVGHWIVLLILAVLAYLTAWLVVGLLAVLLRRVLRHRDAHHHVIRLIRRTRIPVRVFVAVWLWSVAAFFIGVPIVARQYLGVVAEILAWLALAWFAWRVIDALGEVAMERLTARGQVSAVSALHFFRRGAKVALAVLAVIVALDTLGFDVTAGLAALGIGGLALALGAQKTVENLVGSLTVIADRPARVGDFCRFGDLIGTVEDIGMRSTRVRTLARTVVTIPNGELSSMQIENYAHRDQFMYNPTLTLRYETTPDQLRYLLVQLRQLMYGHPKVDPESVWVHFTGFGDSALTLGIFAYLKAGSYVEFLEIQEDLSLRIMDLIAESGTGFALPSQTLYFTRDAGLDADKGEAAETQVRGWRERGELPFPRFEAERIDSLRDSVPYPPEGSSLRGDQRP